jgi:hypothetical protein
MEDAEVRRGGSEGRTTRFCSQHNQSSTVGARGICGVEYGRGCHVILCMCLLNPPPIYLQIQGQLHLLRQ